MILIDPSVDRVAFQRQANTPIAVDPRGTGQRFALTFVGFDGIPRRGLPVELGNLAGVAEEVLRAKQDMGVRMLAARKADVIVAIDHVTAAATTCLESVLRLSGEALHRLIVVTGARRR